MRDALIPTRTPARSYARFWTMGTHRFGRWEPTMWHIAAEVPSRAPGPQADARSEKRLLATELRRRNNHRVHRDGREGG